MALTPRLELKQTQRLTMTPQLRQAINVLEMGNEELTRLIEAEAEENPLLVLKEAPARNRSISRASQHDFTLENLARTNSEGSFDASQHIESAKNLRDDLIAQIRISGREQETVALACWLVDELDENGFLATSGSELCARLKQTPDRIEKAVTLLQTCEPTGVGARDLQECLSLQLVETGKNTPLMMALLENLDILAAGNFAGLAKRLQVSTDTLDKAIAELQTLDPRPASEYNLQIAQTAMPDIFVSKNKDGSWMVELNTAALPKVLINEKYAASLKDGKTEEYLAQCHSNARFLVQAMDQRAKSILRVATAVVRHQDGFFETGVSGLRPLTLADIAAELDIHESTVCRVTKDKYLECPSGNFRMRFFFARRISAGNSSSGIATAIVRERIRELIAAETYKNVYSDEKIVKTLQEGGVNIARRTIAKYRKDMGIPSSSRRRRKQS